jgi:hypothetical protein
LATHRKKRESEKASVFKHLAGGENEGGRGETQKRGLYRPQVEPSSKRWSWKHPRDHLPEGGNLHQVWWISCHLIDRAGLFEFSIGFYSS